MTQPYWSNWYFGWGWFLWFGIFFLMFSSIGHWGYSYRTHRKYGELPGKEALDILNERYARGEITREEWGRMKLEIATNQRSIKSWRARGRAPLPTRRNSFRRRLIPPTPSHPSDAASSIAFVCNSA